MTKVMFLLLFSKHMLDYVNRSLRIVTGWRTRPTI